ncbi:MAG: carboxypeptidase-like regulatory domain-containing protein, partial [Ignavibacteriales bacterium]|nr:carboxypeptidase-like regulatory domain-containing protein [Ignavibacteriales bacterium]
KELSFANVRIAGTMMGTSANAEGKFEFRLKPDNYILITSFIGYKSDTTKINLTQNMQVEISLKAISYELNEVIVTPRENPALRIIRKAIESKHIREENLNSYIFKSYTKGIIKTNRPMDSDENSIIINAGDETDSIPLSIEGILENENIGYYKKPDLYKDEIIARKQTANFPSEINFLTGGRLMQNFYTDDVEFFESPLESPISDKALDYYFYYLEDSLMLDDLKIYKILFETDDNSDPGFEGYVYISDSTFSLIKIDVKINDAANPFPAILKEIKVFQQFLSYEDIYMPIDYRLFVDIELSLFGKTLAASFDLNSIYFDYQINPEISPNFFADDVIIKVHNDADDKDSTYWQNTQTIPTNLEEEIAYARIDSLEAIPKDSSFFEFDILDTKLNFSENFQLNGPIGLSHYHFNRVEGHTIDARFSFDEIINKYSYTSLDLDYGFDDKKFKTDFSFGARFGKSNLFRISVNVYDKLKYLFDDTPISNTEFIITYLSLSDKQDFLEYYYSSGADIKFSYEIHPKINLAVTFSHQNDRTAKKNTDFSIFETEKKFSNVLPIFDSKINSISPQIDFTFRKIKYIEDSNGKRKFYMPGPVMTLSLQGIFSNKSILQSNLDFNLFRSIITTNIRPFETTELNTKITTVYSNGPVPFQILQHLTGNIDNFGREYSFRTLGLYEMFGDRVLAFNLQYNLYDELFRYLNLPILEDLKLNLYLHFNAAYLDISDQSKNILTVPYKTFNQPFYEIGFSIGKVIWILPLAVEFTWKLNHKDGNNFVIGLGMFEF